MMILFIVIIISSLFTQSQQKVITVDSTNGPYETLDIALEAARDNDTIHIHNGTQ